MHGAWCSSTNTKPNGTTQLPCLAGHDSDVRKARRCCEEPFYLQRLEFLLPMLMLNIRVSHRVL